MRKIPTGRNGIDVSYSITPSSVSDKYFLTKPKLANNPYTQIHSIIQFIKHGLTIFFPAILKIALATAIHPKIIKEISNLFTTVRTIFNL